MRLRAAIMPALMLLVGVALVVRSVVEGGGPIATGVILGVLLAAAGAGRLYVEHRSRA